MELWLWGLLEGQRWGSAVVLPEGQTWVSSVERTYVAVPADTRGEEAGASI